MRKGMLLIVLFVFITTAGFSESYQFKPGDYYLLDGRVNVRSEANLTGKVIGQLNINSKITIIECAFNEQTINDVSAYWYKIKYNNSNGYIWGGYIAVQTFIYDIDKNGTNDFFHFRVSRVENGKNIINRNKDTFIYINNSLIKSNFVDKDYPYSIADWNKCQIDMHDGGAFISEDVAYVFSILDENYDPIRGSTVAAAVFTVDKYGRINFARGSCTHSYWFN